MWSHPLKHSLTQMHTAFPCKQIHRMALSCVFRTDLSKWEERRTSVPPIPSTQTKKFNSWLGRRTLTRRLKSDKWASQSRSFGPFCRVWHSWGISTFQACCAFSRGGWWWWGWTRYSVWIWKNIHSVWLVQKMNLWIIRIEEDEQICEDAIQKFLSESPSVEYRRSFPWEMVVIRP